MGADYGQRCCAGDAGALCTGRLWDDLAERFYSAECRYAVPLAEGQQILLFISCISDSGGVRNGDAVSGNGFGNDTFPNGGCSKLGQINAAAGCIVGTAVLPLLAAVCQVGAGLFSGKKNQLTGQEAYNAQNCVRHILTK